jgi:type 1 glutamine amidotransferase
MRCKWFLASLACLVCLGVVSAQDKKKRLLLVTHSGGFMHDSIGVAEQVLKDIGPKQGFDVTCYRYTADPDAPVRYKVKVNGKDEERTAPALARYSQQYRERTGERGKPGEEVTREHCGRINKDTLKNFDIVLFFTTGSKRPNPFPAPLTDDELKDLIDWVKAGGAFAATHCGTDTLYDSPYGELVGAFFRTHPTIHEVKLKVDDPKHPAAKPFSDGMPYTDEWYIFTDTPYSRDKLHVILSIDKESFKPNQKRNDGDYAIAWCHEVGKGKVFYTSMGHRREVWRDARFQEHLLNGIRWSCGLLPGDATPSGKRAGAR